MSLRYDTVLGEKFQMIWGIVMSRIFNSQAVYEEHPVRGKYWNM